MPRGLDQKIAYRILKEHEDRDRARFADYLDKIKSTKENKNTKFFTRETEKQDHYEIEVVVLEKDDGVSETKALSKRFKEDK